MAESDGHRGIGQLACERCRSPIGRVQPTNYLDDLDLVPPVEALCDACVRAAGERELKGEPGRPRKIVVAGKEYRRHLLAPDPTAPEPEEVESDEPIVFVPSTPPVPVPSGWDNVRRVEQYLATRSQEWWRHEMARERRRNPPKRPVWLRSGDPFVRHAYTLDEAPPPVIPCVACGGAVRFDFRGARSRDVLEADAAPTVEALCADCVVVEALPTYAEYSTERCCARHRGRVFKAFGGAYLRSRRAGARHADDVALRTSRCSLCGESIEHEIHSRGTAPGLMLSDGPMREVCRPCAYARGVVFHDVGARVTFAVIDGLTYRSSDGCFQRNTNPHWRHLYPYDERDEEPPR
jgi:hypothetical protein